METKFAPDSAEFYDNDPELAFAELRENDPVHWYEDGGFWCLTRQAEIREVSRNPTVFSSSHGLQMWQIAVVKRGEELMAAGIDGEKSILEMDPPVHNRHRKLVTSAFTPKYLKHLEDRIREITIASLDAFDPSEPIDFVEQVAVPLPMLMIADMIGIPGSDSDTFRRWSDSIVEAGSGGVTEEMINDLAELFEYFSKSLVEHRVEPRSDIITLLQEADIDGEQLSEGEILMFLMTLLVAGNETTRNLIAGGGKALAEHPDQRAKLVADPSLIPGAVDEMLRWVSPVHSFIRYALEDTTLGDKQIRKGDFVVMLYGAANRDQEMFGPTANEFDVTRPDANRHISFGFGEHVCIGAALARMEARIMFEELLARWPTWDIVGEVVGLESCLMNGLVHMPVQLNSPEDS